MQHHILRPRQALNKAYLRLKTSRTEIEAFKTALRLLLDSINLSESEEHVKNHLRDFLKSAFYHNHGINTKGKTDLVIHTGATTKTTSGVLLEVKRPTNKADMPTGENLNYKAMHELVLYYLRERVEHKNNDLKQLIITNVHEWFVFDALEFDRLFFRNGQLKKDFIEWSQGKKSGSNTDFFYKEIVAPFISGLTENITYTYFNLKDYEKPLRNTDQQDDVKLVALYKLLSPAHLLKEAFANDANTLDQGFYKELLYILGLEEVKEGGRKLIRRKAKPEPGSLLEAAYQKLRSEDLVSGLDNAYSYGNTREEQLFNVSLELCITWMNRILFLKLLEAQLASYHHGDKAYVFMSPENIREFDDLNELFFDVLAERPQNRSANVKEKYKHIPYLNSSLFETTALEKHTLRISNLKDNSRLPLYPQTVLRDAVGKPLGKSQPDMRTIEYLLRFLGSYDFGAEGKEAIQEENKTLITASVLGLIFEKINGYRDGSFYTPGFITMYMSREAIRRAVVQRFNDFYSWELADFDALRFRMMANFSAQMAQEANQLINGIRICDPAVGSGHYLVSALNELIVIKAELRILLNRQGKPLHFGSIEVQNDELIVTDHHGELFSYTVHQHPDGHRTINPQVQELQETLFHEKQTIIENCLFGVDINPNSVKICRLRLWIELLKNAYYLPLNGEKEPSSPVCYANAGGLREGFESNTPAASYTELQTLPNIDINIKQGNSLLSRYPLTADLHDAFGKKGHSLQAYREAVAKYKQTNSKEDKKRLVAFLEEIKQGFRTTLVNNDPLRRKMSDLRGQIAVMQNPDLFGAKKVDKKQLQQKQVQLQKLEAEREQIETNKVYEGAFEWRFEFPEVLDEEGKYKGFDVVIGNPPYVRSREIMSSQEKNYYYSKYKTLSYQPDLYKLFIELAILLKANKGVVSYITPSVFLSNDYDDKLRKFILDDFNLLYFTKPDNKVFDEANVEVTVFMIVNKTESSKIEIREIVNHNIVTVVVNEQAAFEKNNYVINSNIDSTYFALIKKIESAGDRLETRYDVKNGIKARKELLTKTSLNDSYKPFILGKDFANFSHPKVKFYLEYIKENEQKFTNQAFRTPEIFESKKVLVRQIPAKDKLVVTVDRAHIYTDQTIYNIRSIQEQTDNLEVLASILNSKLMFFYFRNTLFDSKDLFPKIKRSQLLQLPIATADEETKASITNLVEQILSIKQADAAADTSGLEAEIDLLVYRLYNLTYDEVLLVEPGFNLSREEYEQVTDLAASGGPASV